MSQPTVFISYSHKDEQEKDALLSHLGVLHHAGLIDLWSDDRVRVGDDWEQKISQAMAQAQVAILLISANSLTSDFILRKEIPSLLKRRQSEGLTVFPVIARACAWEKVPWLTTMNVRPKNGRPIWGSVDRQVDEDLAAIAKEIAEIFEKIDDFAQRPVSLGSGQADRTLATKSDTASKGLRALSDLMKTSEAKAAVVAFRIDFQAACEQIDILDYYKSLHDLLHKLQFHCYNPIVYEVKRFSDDEMALDNLIDYELTLQHIVSDLGIIVKRGTFVKHETSWIQDLDVARNSLHQAIEEIDEKQLKKSVWILNRVLALQPAQINTRLNAAARTLRLPTLVETMRRLCNELSYFDLEPEKIRQFEAGVEALDSLNQSLTYLVNHHDNWQMIDVELRLIEANIDQGMLELEISWPEVKARAASLDDGINIDLMEELKEDGEKLDKAIATANPSTVKRCFSRYRRRAGAVFHRVDVDLKRLCEELRRVGEPLTSVMRMIE